MQRRIDELDITYQIFEDLISDDRAVPLVLLRRANGALLDCLIDASKSIDALEAEISFLYKKLAELTGIVKERFSRVWEHLGDS